MRDLVNDGRRDLVAEIVVSESHLEVRFAKDVDDVGQFAGGNRIALR